MASMTDFPTGEEDLPLPSFAEVFGDGSEETILVPNNPVFARRRLASRKAGSRAPGEESAGRWTPEEQKLFLDGLMMYGKDWKRMAPLIKTRSLVQIRTHAQKVFKKLGMKLTEDRHRVGQKRSLDDMHEDYIDEAQLNKLRASGHLEGLVASGDLHIEGGVSAVMNAAAANASSSMMPMHHSNAALVAAAAAAAMQGTGNSMQGVGNSMLGVVVGPSAAAQQQAAVAAQQQAAVAAQQQAAVAAQQQAAVAAQQQAAAVAQQQAAVAAAAAVAMHQQQQAAFAAALMSAAAPPVQALVPTAPMQAAQPQAQMMNFNLTSEETAFLQQQQHQLIQQYQQAQAQAQAHAQAQQEHHLQQQHQQVQLGYLTGAM
jgi:SHAQKYF class myb-like DNA-binding protein